MKIDAIKNSDHTLLVIEGEMTIYNAAEIKSQLLPYFSCDENIEIQLSQVSEIDSAGMQLLMLAKRDISKDGRELRLTAHSKAVLDVLEMYSLAAFFGDPLLMPGGNERGDAARGTL